MNDLTALTANVQAALADRFPGQDFDVMTVDFTESVHVRWYDGPTDYIVQQVVKRALPADVPAICVRWWHAETLRLLVEPLARCYRKATPEIVEWQTAEGLTRAWLAADTDGLDTYRSALAMQDLYQPPAKETEPDSAPVLADYCVASGSVGGGVVRLKVYGDGAVRVLRFSGRPARAVVEALNGLGATWNQYRKTWTTGASVARIQAVIPAQ